MSCTRRYSALGKITYLGQNGRYISKHSRAARARAIVNEPCNVCSWAMKSGTRSRWLGIKMTQEKRRRPERPRLGKEQALMLKQVVRVCASVRRCAGLSLKEPPQSTVPSSSAEASAVEYRTRRMS